LRHCPDLFVTDLERAVRFYLDVLGLLEVDRASGSDGDLFAMLERRACPWRTR
jgi:catechol 2,3-dioxygenase-like lactoylglutathione lyase family enzyme